MSWIQQMKCINKHSFPVGGCLECFWSIALITSFTAFGPAADSRAGRSQARPGEEAAGAAGGGEGHNTWRQSVTAPPRPHEVRSLLHLKECVLFPFLSIFKSFITYRHGDKLPPPPRPTTGCYDITSPAHCMILWSLGRSYSNFLCNSLPVSISEQNDEYGEKDETAQGDGGGFPNWSDEDGRRRGGNMVSVFDCSAKCNERRKHLTSMKGVCVPLTPHFISSSVVSVPRVFDTLVALEFDLW